LLPDSKDQIKLRIAEEVATTKASIAKYRELSKPIAPENAIGRVSRMDAINNKSIYEAALKTAEIKLNNLEVALTKIDDSNFGICIKCNNAIPLGRILLMPQAIRCVHCSQ
jgi:DnaK suppressor protein